jgi:hypothetical protein
MIQGSIAGREEVDEEEPSSPAWESSGVYLAARRRPGGVRNEDVLPILEWGAVEHRIVLPEALQRTLMIPAPGVRWARAKRERVVAQHAQPVERRILEHPTSHLAAWRKAGLEPGKTDVWRVFFRVEGRWCVAVIGRDRNDSYNMVTMHRPSSRSYLRNMLAKGDYVSRRAEECE